MTKAKTDMGAWILKGVLLLGGGAGGGFVTTRYVTEPPKAEGGGGSSKALWDKYNATEDRIRSIEAWRNREEGAQVERNKAELEREKTWAELRLTMREILSRLPR